MLRAGGQQVDPGGLNGTVAQNIRQLHHVLTGPVKGPGEQVPQIVGEDLKLTIKGSKGLIELFNKKGDALTDGTVKHTFELYQYVAGQNNYVKVDEGDYFYGVTPAFSVAGGNSYYVVIDGVQSNIARA